ELDHNIDLPGCNPARETVFGKLKGAHRISYRTHRSDQGLELRCLILSRRIAPFYERVYAFTHCKCRKSKISVTGSHYLNSFGPDLKGHARIVLVAGCLGCDIIRVGAKLVDHILKRFARPLLVIGPEKIGRMNLPNDMVLRQMDAAKISQHLFYEGKCLGLELLRRGR